MKEDGGQNHEVMLYRLDEMRSAVERIEEKIDSNYVSRVEFEPIKRIVYGIVGLVLTSVIVALLALILRQ